MIIEETRNPAAVQLQAVCKTYGAGAARVAALSGVHLSAHQGEMLLLAGPSGCGKTTLLCLIAGLLIPDAGGIHVLGKSLGQLADDQMTEFRRENIGFVFQQFNLIPVLSAAENAAIPLLIGGVPRKAALARAEEMLASMDLAHRSKALPATLSGGEQQRVAIARALIAQPKLVICDEPTASLDGETGAKVMALLRTAAHRSHCCVIVVTHDSRVFPFGDRIAQMSDGRIVNVKQQRAGVCREVAA
jgi:putative ABC transport system ATP-binding protein